MGAEVGNIKIDFFLNFKLQSSKNRQPEPSPKHFVTRNQHHQSCLHQKFHLFH